MTKTRCALATLFATFAASAASITAESGLDLVDSPQLPNETFIAEDGAVIRVAGPDAARPGLWIHKGDSIENLGAVRLLHDPVQGGDYGGRTNLAYDVELVNDARVGTWVYQGRWFAPTTGLYSFAGSFDDRVGLTIDGRSVLAQEWAGIGVKQDVPLAAGWHDVEICFVNEKGGMGVRDGLPKGLVWSAENLAFTRDNIGDGNLFDDPGDGSRLQQVHNGAFCRRLDIPSGTVTLDLTQSGLAGPFCFGAHTGILTGPGAKLLVRGADTLLVNGQDDGGVHFPLIDADVEFADNPDGKVRIVGRASIERMRSNYVVEDGSEVAYWGTNMIVDAEWVLTNRSAQLLSTAAVAPETKITIADGSTLTVKPCRHNPSHYWSWQGVQGQVPNDVSVWGEYGALVLRDYRDLEVSGRITGDGVVAAMDSPSQGAARLTGDLTDFEGTLRVYEWGQLTVEGALPPGGVKKVNLGYLGVNNGGIIRFRPEGVDENETAVRIVRAWGTREDAYVEAAPKQEITIASFGGTGALKTANLTDSHITVESLDAGATLVLRYTANVTLAAAGAGAKVKVFGDSSLPGRLVVPEQLDAIELVGGAKLFLAGTGVVGKVTGRGVVELGAGVSVRSVDPNVTLRFGADAVLQDTDAAALASALGPTPALWLDASRTDTLQQYLNCVFTNGIVVRRWNDCRPDQTALYGLNPRGEGYARVYPYVLSGALNGKDVVSMGAVGGQVESQYGHVNVATGEPVDALDVLQPETRRLPFNRPIRVRTAILVFGSQFGGGGAILGGDTDQGVKDLQGAEKDEWTKPATGCAFARAGSDPKGFSKPGTAIFKDQRNCWVDGVAVDPTKTGFSGDWQIVSFESKAEDGEEVRSLGMIEGYQNSGGQTYAEVLLYTNALTAAERSAVELHLMRKWGLGGRLPLNGTGRFEVADLFPAEGAFAGTVDLAAGGVLDLGAVPAPMTEAEMPSEGRIGWFDPDWAESLELSGEGPSEKNGTNAVYGVFDRGKARVPGTPYLHGTYNAGGPVGGSGDRRPWAVRGARGNGPERTWLSFYEDPSDGGGNTLRVKTDPTKLRVNNPPDYSNTTLGLRTAFLVSDSSHGGGNPIGDTVRFDGQVRRRAVDNVASPIWARGTTASISNGLTRLDGQAVNGFAQGFSGAPEVLSFTTTNVFPAAFFGSCGTGAGERSYEVLGEIVLFDRELVGEERDSIEIYLMNKWLGRLPGGWCDWSRATVTGAGTVKATALSPLPAFAADFAGMLDLAGGRTFHVDAANVVTDALALPATATLKLPAAGTVRVSFAGRPKSCTLATAGTVTGFDAAGWTVQVEPATTGTCRLDSSGGQLRLVVLSPGTQILIR